ncbi:MAG TPA: hypothetical protein VNO14_19810, partial [Blastocatellia bacterium]|nr:hypothetical protein [Blastocatellia bacterium]
FLRKSVAERPSDGTAWLELARHYLGKADDYASQEPNDDYTPPDPRPYYEKALECFNRAVELGEGSFQTHLARARIADTLEMKSEAKAYGESALNVAPPGEGHEVGDQIKWLREMVARNSDSVRREVNREEIEIRIRLRRLESLPSFIRWGVSRFM